MYNFIFQEKKLFYTLLFWMIVGIASRTAAMLVIPLHLLSMKGKPNVHLMFLLGLWFIMLLSDSRQYFFAFAKTIKPIVMLAVAFLIWTERRYWSKTIVFSAFIPFFFTASISTFNSPIQFNSIQKLISYFIILFVIPQLIINLLQTEKERFMKGVVTFGTLVLLIGLVMKYVMPGIVTFETTGRFNGLLGNPNGLGIFTFVFLMLYMLIKKYHPEYFTQKENWIILGSIIASLILAGSRGGIFSSILFITGYFLFQRSIFMGFIVMISIFVSYQLVMANLEEIIIALNLQDYFRLDTLEQGSGRLVAFKFAWEHIQYNYWIGRGFGYTKHLMHKYQNYFLSMGHQGNVHNSYLTIWLDTGLIGLSAFIFGWLKTFYKASRFSPLIWAVMFGIMLTTTVESWLAASMNPFTIQLVIILTMLSTPEFYTKTNKSEV